MLFKFRDFPILPVLLNNKVIEGMTEKKYIKQNTGTII